jgi:hypothetical protein
VTGDDSSGGISQYTLPLQTASTPNFTIALPNAISVALDSSGNVLGGSSGGKVTIYAAPISASSVATASFSDGASAVGQAAFTSNGNFLIATQSTSIEEFTAPFKNASTPSGSFTDPSIAYIFGTALDAAQNAYVESHGVGTATTCSAGAAKCSEILVFAPPYTGTPIITPLVANGGYRSLAVDATHLYAATIVSGTNGRIDAYNLPITSSSSPAFSITAGASSPEGLAVDPAGNLYVGNFNSSISVYAPPITASSTPTITYTINTGYPVFGVAIGK